MAQMMTSIIWDQTRQEIGPQTMTMMGIVMKVIGMKTGEK